MTDLRPLADIPTDPADDTWQPIDLNTLPDKPPVEPNLAGTGLIYPGKRHVFSGPPESAKTLAAYAILIHVTRHQETAALIDFEMGAYDARQRLRELGGTPAEIGRILYLEPDTPANEHRVTQLVDRAPALVVIDAAAGAYQLQGLDDNRRNEVETFSRLYIAAFWRANIATILIDHVVKDQEHRGRFAIGSERKLGGADVHLGFDTIQAISRGTAGRYKITVHKDRGGYHKRGHLADLHLTSDPDTHAIDWRFTDPERTTAEDGHFRPTHLMEKVSRDLEGRTEPVTRTSVAEALGGRKEYVLKAISALVAEGFVAEEDGPSRAKLIRSSRPYRENDESANTENGSTMRAEPRELLSSQTTWSESADLAQPCGGSVVPGGSRVVPGTGTEEWFRGSPPYGGDTREPLRADPPEQPGGSRGWFDDDGHLTDTPLDYLTTIEPDADDDIVWPTP